MRGFGVAGLPFGRDGANLDKAKAHGTQAVDAARAFLSSPAARPRGWETQARQFDGSCTVSCTRPIQRRALADAREHVHGQFMGGFGGPGRTERGG